MHGNYTLKPALSPRAAIEEPCPRMTDSPFRLPPNFKFWLVIVALALTALIVFSEILLPFAAGFVLAYLFHPFVSALNRIGIPRGAGALVVIMVLALFVALMIALILPPLLDELGQLIEKTPAYYQDARAFLLKHYAAYLQRLGYSPSQGPQEAQRQIAQDLAPWVLAQAKSVLQGGLALFNSLALAFLTPVVTFFLLRDWTQMIAAVEKVLPRKDAPTIKAIARDIDWTISGYMRGTLIVLVIVSGFYMAALGIIGLNYGLIIGLGAGLISFVPYLGSSVGFLVSGGVAAAQFWPDYATIAIVCGVFVLGQVVEGNVLTPNIVGGKVRLHPVWLLFSLIASGYLLGFTGLLISVPLAAVIGVLVRFAIREYYRSAMYENGKKHDGGIEPTG